MRDENFGLLEGVIGKPNLTVGSIIHAGKQGKMIRRHTENDIGQGWLYLHRKGRRWGGGVGNSIGVEVGAEVLVVIGLDVSSIVTTASVVLVSVMLPWLVGKAGVCACDVLLDSIVTTLPSPDDFVPLQAETPVRRMKHGITSKSFAFIA
jgi:hypothetical protein